MPAKRVFISFDFDHDEDLRNLLVGQSRNPDTPFEIIDWSVKEAFAPMFWKAKVQERIAKVDLMIVICGEYMGTATGVDEEINIARNRGLPIYFLKGRADKNCVLPKMAGLFTTMIDWTWVNLKVICGGGN